MTKGRIGIWSYLVPCGLIKHHVKTSIGFTPFHLVYGKEALLPIEVELPMVWMLENMLGHTTNAFKERLLHLQRVQLD